MRPRLVAVVAVTACSALFVPALANAAEGDLDPSFGTGGKVTTAVSGGDDQASGLAVQPDGKIVAVGAALNSSNSHFDFAVVRYNPDGSLDPSFGTGGKVTTDFMGANDIATSVAIDPQGRIVVAGRALFGDYDFAAARYNDNGTLDTTFGPAHTGMVLRDFTPSGGDDDEANAVVIDAQGRIVLAGSSNGGGTHDFALTRLNPNGSLDTSFGAGGTGMVTTPIGGGGSFDQVNALALQPDGKLVAAGFANNGSNNDFALARYNANGTLDPSFDVDGKVTTPIGNSSDEANALVLQPDGKLVAAGFADNGSNEDFALARYNPDGSLDTSFDFDGKATTPIGSSNDEAHALALQPDGKLVAAGSADNGSNNDFALARYNPNGSLDTSFNADGKVTTPFGDGFDSASALAVQPDGKLVAAGSLAAPMSPSDIALARYIGDQTPPGAPSIRSGPANGSYTNDPTPTFQFSSSEAGTMFACGFGGGAAACTSPFTPSPLADGAHTFSLTATDRAGNASAAATRTFRVDTHKPELKVKGKSKVKTAGRKAKDKLKLKANEPATFRCKVDRRKARKCSARYKTPKLKLGKHKVKVTATDRAGNKASKTKKLKVVRKR